MLGSKGEEHCPDLEQAGVESEQLRTVFSGSNKDKLHICSEEDCDDDYKGLMPGRRYRERREYYNQDLDVLLVFR